MNRFSHTPDRGCAWHVSFFVFFFLLLSVSSASAQTVFLESGGQVVVEAETFSSRTASDTHEWLIVPEEIAGFPSEFTDYRGDGYVQARPEGFGGSTPLNPPFIDYTVRISTIGTYRLYVRWVGPNNDSDTVYASVVELSDGSGGSIADWYRYVRVSSSFSFAASPTWFGSGGFERTDSPATNGETAVVWNITTPGDYTIRFDMREDGAAIDAFVFQLSSLSAPTGDGPPPSDIAIPFGVITRIPPIVLGDAFSRQLETEGGVEPATWSVVDGTLPEGMTLSGDGVFSGTPTVLGESTFTVQVTDDAGEVAERTYTVEVVLVLPPPEIRIEKVGSTAVPGRTLDYFIVLENGGIAEAHDVVVEEHLVSSNFSTGVFEFVSGDPEPDFVQDGLVLVWVIPSVEPGQRQILSYRVSLNAAIPLGTPISGNACRNEDGNIDLGVLQSRMSNAGEQCADCVNACNQAYCNNLKDCKEDCDDIPWPFKKICISGCGIVFAECSGCLAGCADNYCKNECESNELQAAASNSPGCPTCPDGCGCDEQEASGPVDPNEKLVVAERFIQPDQTLVYPIHFENIGDVEARDVFVTDVLDANLDESTLEILTPDGASYDSASRTVSWELLDRNLQPDETDNVFLAAKPAPGLPSGTEIPNVAEIQFEIFDPLVTPEVVNIIDTDKPNCVVDDFPAVTSTEEFTVSWTGTDAVGEVEAYAVFVSANGGGWEPFLAETSETSAQFAGENGSTYDFLCAARDTAGNTEEDSLLAEATTTVEVVSAPASLGDLVWQDTNRDARQDASEPGIAGVTVELLDAGANVIGTTVTDADGVYLFEGLVTGTYIVRFLTPSGFVITDRDQGDDTLDSDANPVTGQTVPIVLSSGESNLTIDAGFYHAAPPGDLDGDGIPDSDDECPETPSGEDVDQTGCSAMQFCNHIALGGFLHPSRWDCRKADWKDNETRTFPLDCRIDRNRTPLKPHDDTCVSTRIAN